MRLGVRHWRAAASIWARASRSLSVCAAGMAVVRCADADADAARGVVLGSGLALARASSAVISTPEIVAAETLVAGLGLTVIGVGLAAVGLTALGASSAGRGADLDPPPPR